MSTFIIGAPALVPLILVCLLLAKMSAQTVAMRISASVWHFTSALLFANATAIFIVQLSLCSVMELLLNIIYRYSSSYKGRKKTLGGSGDFESEIVGAIFSWEGVDVASISA